jgi:hypothetical protein
MFWNKKKDGLESLGYPILDGPIEDFLQNPIRELILWNGAEFFIFRYRQGEEEELSEAIRDMVDQF